MFHHPAVEWTGLQAETLGIPHVTAETSAVKEEEIGALRESLSRLVMSQGIDCVVTGAIASEYQKSRIDRVCDGLRIRAVAPLWRINPSRLVKEQVAMGFEFIITACMAMGLDRRWLGRVIDDRALGELQIISRKHGLNMAFEGGEAETFVVNAPIFRKKVRVVEAEPVWKGDSGFLNIVRADLVASPS